jgi:hypothetical protein
MSLLRSTPLLRGRKLGIDSSVLEANASLRALEHRKTEESYWDYPHFPQQLHEQQGRSGATNRSRNNEKCNRTRICS